MLIYFKTYNVYQQQFEKIIQLTKEAEVVFRIGKYKHLVISIGGNEFTNVITDSVKFIPNSRLKNELEVISFKDKNKVYKETKRSKRGKYNKRKNNNEMGNISR